MQIFIAIFLALTWSLALPVCPRAEVVGRFLQVEGPVDLLKQGKPPAQIPKVQDGVEPGDAVRTKTQGRAQVKFVDDSVLTIAPGSMVVIETYMYDGATGKRQAVLQVFRGMVQTAVSRIFKVQKPDFIMKTHTAVLGVKGTKWFALLGPNHTDFYNQAGRTWIQNINAGIQGGVLLKPMEFTRVLVNQTPSPGRPFFPKQLLLLQHLLKTGVGGAPSPGAAGGPAPFAFLDQLHLLDPRNPAGNPQSALYKPPEVIPPYTPPPPHHSHSYSGPMAGEGLSGGSYHLSIEGY